MFVKKGKNMFDIIQTVKERFDSLLKEASRLEAGKSRLDIHALERDTGCAMLFNFIYKDVLMFVPEFDKWYSWQGNYWKVISKPHAAFFVQGLVNNLFEKRIECLEKAQKYHFKIGDKGKADLEGRFIEKLKHQCISRLQSAKAKFNVLEECTIDQNPETSLVVSAEKLDQKPYLIAVKNGVIDLKANDEKLREGRQDDYLTVCAPVEYKKDAKCNRFQKMILEIFNEKTENQTAIPEISLYFQRLIGMSLVGKVLEKVCVILYGPEGNSGKTTTFEILRKILGDYVSPFPVGLILGGKNNNPNGAEPAKMDLKGRRIVWASEPAEGQRFDDGDFKLLTGGDTIPGRYPYQKEIFTFEPTHTPFMLSNNKPYANAFDSSMWDRIRLIHCPSEFVKNPDPSKPNQKKADPDLKDYILENEASGVLNWCIEGYTQFKVHQGSDAPKCIETAMKDYRNEEDCSYQFKEQCLVEEEGNIIFGSEMYARFKAWYEEEYGNRNVPSNSRFGKLIKRHITKFDRGKSNRVRYHNYAFRKATNL